MKYKTSTIRKDKKTGRKIVQYYPKSLISNEGIFLTGFIPRIENYCKLNNIPLEIYETEENKILNNLKVSSHTLPGISLRPDQEDSVQQLLKAHRGIFLAHPRYGKSYVMASILKAYEKYNSLILCARTSILLQLKDDFVKFGLNIDRIDFYTPAGIRNKLENKTLHYSVIIGDESHQGAGFSGMVDKIMTSLAAPIRFGFTGTMPQTEEQNVSLEGMYGPIIKHVDFNEGKELDILTSVKLELIPVPKNKSLSNLSRYVDIYEAAIVEDRSRNRLIIEKAKELNDKGLSVLIFVTELKHGENLYSMAEGYGLDPVFINGSTEHDERELEKSRLKNKDSLCVISTTVWKEGQTFNSLDCVIYACGGKSSVANIQGISRALGKHANKEVALAYDFLDTGKYISEHAIERIKTYKSLNWI